MQDPCQRRSGPDRSFAGKIRVASPTPAPSWSERWARRTPRGRIRSSLSRRRRVS